MNRVSPWRSLAGAIGTLLVIFVLASACSDDPILGPTESPDDGGGSYSAIERLAPPTDSGAVQSDTTRAKEEPNPARF
ncbi:MAG: hypothetical protein R6T83_01800 [Salinibacter sp.]